jgi:hypothetical protein
LYHNREAAAVIDHPGRFQNDKLSADHGGAASAPIEDDVNERRGLIAIFVTLAAQC